MAPDLSSQGPLLGKILEGRGQEKDPNLLIVRGEELLVVSSYSVWKGCKVKIPTGRESSLLAVWYAPGGGWGGWGWVGVGGGTGRKGGHQ